MKELPSGKISVDRWKLEKGVAGSKRAGSFARIRKQGKPARSRGKDYKILAGCRPCHLPPELILSVAGKIVEF
jgi:hypothetical protein